MKILAALAVLVLCSASAVTQTTPTCRGLEGLVGEWAGIGAGQPGPSSAGGFTFARELQGKVLVRRSFAQYAATKDRPAFRHDDLTIIYDDPASKTRRADYFDSEGHVIHYAVENSADGCTVTFLSPVTAAEPGYRLTYVLKSAADVDIRFEIAPPGKEFATYLNASARRK